MTTTKTSDGPYAVMVDDNYHPHDPDSRYCAGRFATVEEAIAKCKEIVEEQLRSYLQQEIPLDALVGTFASWGDEPFITGTNVNFSARGFGEELVAEWNKLTT